MCMRIANATLMTIQLGIIRMSSKATLSATYHIERSIASRQGLAEYLCACKDCRGSRVLKVDTVARHHRIRGRDPYLKYLILVSSIRQ